MLNNWEEIFRKEGFVYKPIGGGDGTEPPVVEEAPPAPPEEEPKSPEVPPVVTPPQNPETDKSSEAIQAINETLAKQTELLNSLSQKVDARAEEKEWTLEQLRDAELKVYSGEYEQKWLPLINEKRATIIAKQIASEEKKQYTKESDWNSVNEKWNQGMANAVRDFGKEAEDPNSELFKTAQNLLRQDLGYKRFQELKADGKKLSEIDPKLIDPSLQYKCFEIAHSRITRKYKDSPKVPSKGSSKDQLGGPTLPKPDSSTLQQLEARAADTGNPSDWIAYDKERLRQKRGA